MAIGPPLRRWERRAWTGQPPHIGRRGLVPWKSWPVVCRGGGLDRPPVRPSLSSLSVSPPLFLRRRLLASVVPSSPSSFASACAVASSLLSVDVLRFLCRRSRINKNVSARRFLLNDVSVGGTTRDRLRDYVIYFGRIASSNEGLNCDHVFRRSGIMNNVCTTFPSR